MKNFLAGLSRVWFPLSLLALLLLAIPGILLFVLNLLGKQSSINEALQKTFSLTYHVPIAWWAALLLLLVPFLIALLYFLKLKRKPLHVPSTFLWKKSIEDLHVNSLFQWLRENVLLLLQLLAVLAMIYAIMAFRLHGSTRQGKHYILMIDNSASMSATDVSPSRLHAARKEALKVIDANTDDDFGMVIAFNSSAEILQSYTNNRHVLRGVVEGIPQTQRPTRIDEALSLADSLANPTRSTENEAVRPANEEPGKERTYAAAEGISAEMHLFSDGRFPDVPDFALGNLNVHYHAIGRPGSDDVNNLALVTLNSLRDDRDPSKLIVFVRALNFRIQPARTKIQLEVRVNGELKALYEKPDKDPLVLPARSVIRTEPEKEDSPVRDTPGERSVTFELNDVDDGANVVLHALLVDARDQFPLDDEAWLVVGVVRKARVLIVGPSNPILRAFFDHEATEKVATITYLTPNDLNDADKYRNPARDGAFDLVIFDRCGPAREEDMPLANTFFIDSLPPPWKKADMPKVENPHIKGWLGKHPLVRYLAALHDIGISEAFQFNLKDPQVPPRTPRLIETDRDAAVLFPLSRQSFTDLVMAFAIINDKGDWNTNWPLQPSFPLFLRNVLYTLGNVSDAGGEETVQPGQVKTLRPDVAVKKIDVIDPPGNSEPLQRGTRSDFAYGKTERVGVYQVSWDGRPQRSFAVNLLDPEESNLEPRLKIQIGAEGIAAGAERGQPRETWKWVALLALFLLLLEWYIYNRRVYV